VPVVLIAGILGLGKPQVPQQSKIIVKNNVISAKAMRTNQAESTATNAQALEERTQRVQLVARAKKQFKSEYVAPAGCDNWKSKEKMVECVNDHIRATRMFVAQHPEYSALSEFDLR
jgi:hypothetical protein